ncbi:serine/threonine-protein kinase HipA [Pseudoxanthomonas sp. GM95]|uniref:type II toxin-antitoxin system HipA family toxin n=1 Tax=Pseudoxanthomonas sp. GM95 TaxID=1881043 RepID=UPI0008C2C4C2|nr:HipA domain-containing protein [Pseudoxanthomonas sp. GM95]SEL14793.1 serine/threonine-protein kinase HipA [Pseudoxanthomonas sp. GM95]
MESYLELHANGIWHRAGTVTVRDRLVFFDHDPLFVFETAANTGPVSICVEPDAQLRRSNLIGEITPLAFLWDLVPQGEGRKYVAEALAISPADPLNDLILAAHGAYAPIGRLRLSKAVRFYEEQTEGAVVAGFDRDNIFAQPEAFREQLALYNMLTAGTPGVQGVAPKFLLSRDEDGLYYADAALSDERAVSHWMLKYPRGRSALDLSILRHEAIYLQAAAACGLRTIVDVEFREGMLLLSRFDRQVREGKVVRLHQETLSALCGQTGFGTGASLFELTQRLAQVATDPAVTVTDFLCRDVLNQVLGNTDNHLRNTSVQRLEDGTIQLTPIYDLSPMYRDPEIVVRSSNWKIGANTVTADWDVIFGQLDLPEAVKGIAARELRRFGEEQLPGVIDHLMSMDADSEIVERCRRHAEQQISQIQRMTGHANS